MSNVITMNGDAVRTVADVLHELNEQVAAGEVAHLLVVIQRPNSHRNIDWDNQSMADFVFTSTTVQHNLIHKLGDIQYNE